MSVITYEQRRISTIRSTWIILALTLLLAGLVAAGLAAVGNIATDTGERIGLAPLSLVLSTVGSPMVFVPLSVMAAMALGGDYRFGLIRTTLTAFPRRTPVYFAKLGVALLWALAFALAATVVCVLVALALRSNVDVAPFTAENLGYAGRTIVFVLGYCSAVFALVALTRNQALGIIVALLWVLAVEQIVLAILGNRLEWLADVLPGSASSRFVSGDGVLQHGAAFLALVLLLVALGWWRFRAKDA